MTPSGLKTELQDTAKASSSEPPQFLAVGVAELHAVERGVGGVGEDGVAVGDARLQNAREGDHLERRAGGLQAVEADARHREDLAGGGVHRDDPAVLPAERGDRGTLNSGEMLVRTAVAARGGT